MEHRAAEPRLNVVPIVTEVWETYLILKLARFATGDHFELYHLYVAGPNYRFDQHLSKVDAPLRISDLTAGTEYTIGVRGQHVKGGDDWTGFTELTVTTALPMRIENAKISETSLQIRWVHGASTELLAPIVRYQLEVISKEFVLATEIFNRIVETTECVDGTFAIDYLKPNHSYYARARPQNAEGHWGAWCEETRLLTVRNAYIMPEEIGETYALVSWCRTGGRKFQDPMFKEQDCLIKRFHLRVWQAGPRHNGNRILPGGKTKPWFRYEAMLEEPSPFSKNVARVPDLIPNRTYLLRAVYQNVQGDWSVPLYFRFNSLPTISLHTITLLTTDQIHATWVRETVKGRDRDISQDIYDDGSANTFNVVFDAEGQAVPRPSSRGARTLNDVVIANNGRRKTDAATAEDPQLLGASMQSVDSPGREAKTEETEKVAKDPNRISPIEWVDLYSHRQPVSSQFGIRCVDIATGESRQFSAPSDETTCIIKDLNPGTTYALSLRSLVHGDWSGWSRSVVVTTLRRLQVMVYKRGSAFISVRWGRSGPNPVLYLNDNEEDEEEESGAADDGQRSTAEETASTTTAEHKDNNNAFPSPPPSQHSAQSSSVVPGASGSRPSSPSKDSTKGSEKGPSGGAAAEGACDWVMIPALSDRPFRIVSRAMLGSDVVTHGMNQVCIQLDEVTEGPVIQPTSSGVEAIADGTEPKDGSQLPVPVDSTSVKLQKRFTSVNGAFVFAPLKADMVYSISIRFEQRNGQWIDGNVIQARTLSTTTVSVDEVQDTPDDDIEDIAHTLDMLDLASTRFEITGGVLQKGFRVELSKLDVTVGEVGEAYAVIAWRLFEQQLAVFQAIDAEKQKLSGKERLVEYRVQLRQFRSADDEDETVETVKEVYFRHTQCATRITNLTPNRKYALSICRYYNNHEKWGEYSDEVYFTTAKQIELVIQNIHKETVVLKWRRYIIPQERQGSDSNRSLSRSGGGRSNRSMAIAMSRVLSYQLRVSNCESPEPVFIKVQPSPSGDLFTTYALPILKPDCVYCVAVRPEYGNELWGTYSEPLFFKYDSIEFKIISVGEEQVYLRWLPRPVTAEDRMHHRGCMDKIVCSIAEHRILDETTGVHFHRWVESTELPIVASDHRFTNLKHQTTYAISVTAVQQIARPSEAYPENPNFGKIDPSEPCPITPIEPLKPSALKFRVVCTLKPIDVWIQSTAEDSVTLAWSRQGNPPEEEKDWPQGISARRRLPSAGAVRSQDTTTSDQQPAQRLSQREFLESKLEQELIKARERNPEQYPQYEIRITEVLTAQHSVLLVNPSGDPIDPAPPTQQNGDDSVDPKHRPASGKPPPGVVYKRVNGLRPENKYLIWIRRQLTCGQWGSWSSPYTVSTWHAIHVAPKSIGENFLVVHWYRPSLSESAKDDSKPTQTDDFASKKKYAVKIWEVPQRPKLVRQSDRLYRRSQPASSDSLDAVSPLSATEGPQGVELAFANSKKKSVKQWQRMLETSEAMLLLADLQPDTLYAVSVRESSYDNAWGSWSQPATMRTLAEVNLQLLCTGQDYLDLGWQRLSLPVPTAASPQVAVVEGEGHRPSNVIGFDKPASRSVLKAEARIPLVVTRIHVRTVDLNAGEEMVDEIVCGAGTPDQVPTQHRVEKLSVNTPYQLAVRFEYDGEWWGMWTPNFDVTTLPSIDLVATTIGEDFIALRWGQSAEATQNIIRQWQINVTPVQPGPATVDGAEVVQQSFEPAQKEHTVLSLIPDKLYRITIRSLDFSNHWSPWSKPLFCSTIPLLTLRLKCVAEGFACVTWERKPFAYTENINFVTDEEVQLLSGLKVRDTQYEVVVFEVLRNIFEEDIDAFEPNGRTADDPDAILCKNAMCVTHRFGEGVSSFRCEGLKAATHYGIIARALQERGEDDRLEYGIWSRKEYFKTQPVIRLDAVAVGQDYITVRWRPSEFVNTPSTSTGGGGGGGGATPGGTMPSPSASTAPSSTLSNVYYGGPGTPQGGALSAHSKSARSVGAGTQRTGRLGGAASSHQHRHLPSELWPPAAVSQFLIVITKTQNAFETNAPFVPYSNETAIDYRTASAGDDGGGGGASPQAPYTMTNKGLSGGCTYELIARRIYDKEMTFTEEEKAKTNALPLLSAGNPVRVTTLPPATATIITMDESSAMFEVRVPITSEKLMNAAKLGDTKAWMKPRRQYDVRVNSVRLPTLFELDMQSQEPGKLILSDLEKDKEYSVLFRENPKTLGSGWCHLCTFRTLPFAPLPGELVECRNGIVAFTWGMMLGEDPNFPGSGARSVPAEAVPQEFLYCIEYKMWAEGDENASQTGLSEWQIAGIQERPVVRLRLERPIADYSFRIKSSRHFAFTSVQASNSPTHQPPATDPYGPTGFGASSNSLSDVKPMIDITVSAESHSKPAGSGVMDSNLGVVPAPGDVSNPGGDGGADYQEQQDQRQRKVLSRAPLWGPYSVTFRWKTPPPPATVTGLRVSRLKSRSCNVQWERPLNAPMQPQLVYSVHMMYDDDAGGKQWQHVSTQIPTRLELTNLEPYTTYRVAVRSLSNFGRSKKSAMVAFTTHGETYTLEDEEYGRTVYADSGVPRVTVPTVHEGEQLPVKGIRPMLGDDRSRGVYNLYDKYTGGTSSLAKALRTGGAGANATDDDFLNQSNQSLSRSMGEEQATRAKAPQDSMAVTAGSPPTPPSGRNEGEGDSGTTKNASATAEVKRTGQKKPVKKGPYTAQKKAPSGRASAPPDLNSTKGSTLPSLPGSGTTAAPPNEMPSTLTTTSASTSTKPQPQNKSGGEILPFVSQTLNRPTFNSRWRFQQKYEQTLH